jgi:hypothetical protein
MGMPVLVILHLFGGVKGDSAAVSYLFDGCDSDDKEQRQATSDWAGGGVYDHL